MARGTPIGVYVAAPFMQRAAAIHATHVLERLGYVVTSRWTATHLTPDITPAQQQQEALADLLDIHRADVFVLLNIPTEKPTGGKDVEMGVAYMKGKRLFVVGSATNIFHYLPGVTIVSVVEEIHGLLCNL